MTPAANTCPKCGKPLPNYDVMKDYCRCTHMTHAANKPLIGWMILEDYCADMSQWNGVISYPNPTGANLAWENPTKMVEYSAYAKAIAALNYVATSGFNGCSGRDCEKIAADCLRELGEIE